MRHPPFFKRTFMIRKKEDMELLHVENSGNVKGELTKQFLLYSDETYGKTSMCAVIELPHGSMIAEHDHTMDAEMYYLLEGEAVVTDNDDTHLLHAGDVVFTGGGNRHSIRNESGTTIHFVAIIFK